MENNLFVSCRECGERHSSEEVETVNIEEDERGYDVLTFICPVTKEETSSLVFSKR